MGAPRPGTLLFTRPIDGTATIYVAGTDGELHGFATPKQFVSDGYDPALVVTVTNLGQLGVGASAGAWNGWCIAGGCTPADLIREWTDPRTGTLMQWGPHRSGCLRPDASHWRACRLPRYPGRCR